jgi:predicted dehydrogenase
MSERRPRVGVVGCGHLGSIHARLLASRDDVDLVAVCDPVNESRTRIAGEYRCDALADPGELVGRVDAAVVAAPTARHAAVAVPLLEAGVDLLVEKPLAGTVEDARDIVIAARRHGRVVAVGHVERFNPAWQAAAVRARGVSMLSAERLAPFSFRSLDVGVVLDLMIHDIDLVLSLEPGRLERVEAHGLVATGGHEDMARARLSFASGLVADLTASRISPEVRRSITMWTREGIVSCDFNTKSLTVLSASPAVREGRFDAAAVPMADRAALRERFFTEVLPLERESVPDINAIAAEHDDFLAAVRDRTTPRVPAAAAGAALEIAARVLEAMACTHFGAGNRVVVAPATIPVFPRRKTG